MPRFDVDILQDLFYKVRELKVCNGKEAHYKNVNQKGIFYTNTDRRRKEQKEIENRQRCFELVNEIKQIINSL